jgi:hypothetical protein
MTETEWLAATDPVPMVEFVRSSSSDRKFRLLACAFARHYWLPDVFTRALVKLSERYADGQRSLPALRAARKTVPFLAHRSRIRAPRPQDTAAIRAEAEAAAVAYCTGVTEGWRAASTALRHLRGSEHLGYSGSDFVPYVHDVIGNPHRARWLDPKLLEWNDGVVAKVAENIYQHRSFRRLPILADALEDAGCTDAELLGHLRGPGPHARGCWALDLVLSKS